MLYGGIYMKKRLLLLASVLVACMIPLTQAFALDSANVIGCGKVSVKADCAYIEVGVEAIGQDPASAEAQSGARERVSFLRLRDGTVLQLLPRAEVL